MPFIFPKRFLRTRDVLDPFEMSQDLQPLQELCDGELDRHNFNATDLKANIDPIPFGAGGITTPSVAPKAYYDFADAAVECQVNCGTPDAKVRTPPNFVRTDGTTFRVYPQLDDGYPSIIPNSGEESTSPRLTKTTAVGLGGTAKPTPQKKSVTYLTATARLTIGERGEVMP